MAPARSAAGPGRPSLTAELVIFENSSHLAFIEERGPYIQTVSDFLTRAGARPPPG